jgi:hypothetical protein
LLLAVAPWFCVSCHTTAPLPPANLSAPGWTLRQGQAVWKPSQNRPELVGELLFAANANGDYLIQFSKPPFALASAQVAGDEWQIDFGGGKHTWAGRGEPPRRFVWFQLPRALAGGRPMGSWQLGPATNNFWRLENHRTGEFLEGEFFP